MVAVALKLISNLLLFIHNFNKGGTKGTRGTVILIDRKKTDNAMAKNKKTNRQMIVQKTQHRKLKTKQHEPIKNWGDLTCSGRVSRSCSTCITRRVAYVITNPVNSLTR